MLTDGRGIGEWGFSAVIDTGARRILFDTGARPETVLNNARELKVDLAEITDVVLSHGHGDHTGGLITLRRELSKTNPSALSRTWVGAGIFESIPGQNGAEGNPTRLLESQYEDLGGKFSIIAAPTEIAPGIWLTGPMPRRHPERNWSGSRKRETSSGLVEDVVQEDTSLVAITPRGLVVVTGCGHAGVVNTLEYARGKISNTPVYAVIGGMHLFALSDERLDWTAAKLRSFGLQQMLGAHCTGIEAVIHMRNPLGLSRKTAPVGAVGATFDLREGINPGVIAR